MTGVLEPRQPEPARPAPAPSAVAAPALQAAELEPVTLELARILGPIARKLVQRASQAGRSRQDVIAAVAREIDDAAERKQFLSRFGAQLT